MDHRRLASDLLRELRGRRSQPAFARWLGFRSNVAYAWESGRAYPTALETLRILKRQRRDVRALFVRFYRREPPWLSSVDPASCAGVAAFLDDLRGRVPISELAKRAGHSRFAVARWLSGETEVRLPEFFSIVQAASLRLLDFIALIVDPANLPSVAASWRQLEAARRAAYELPWSQAVLRALELESYCSPSERAAAWIAKHLGIPEAIVAQSLDVLVECGQIRLDQNRYHLIDTPVVDTRRDPERAWEVREFWTDAARERLAARKPGLYWYNVFGVSERDLTRIRELQAQHFRELRALIEQSHPVERVVLSVQHLIALDGSDEP